MNCPTCGTNNREGARFCRGCGAALTEPPPVETEPVEDQAVVEEAAASSPDEPEGEPVEEGAEPLPEAEAPAAEPEAEPVEDKAPVEPPVAEGDKELELPPEPEEDVVAFWRDEPKPLKPAPVGAVIADRYELVEVLDEQPNEILYLARDLVACWQCGFEGNTPGDAFCAQCGVALDAKAEVQLLEVQPAGAEPSGDQTVAARLGHEGRTFLLLADAELQQAPEAEPGAEAKPPVSNIRLLVGQRSDPGQVRELNEDSTLVLTLAPTYQSRTAPVLGLLAVADGMGGHEGGEVASKLALQELVEQAMYTLLLPEMAGEGILDEDIVVSLRQAVMAANDAVFLARQKAGNDMGTTLTAAYVRDNRLFLAHVGDCRAYRWNAAGLTQLTADHSVVASMIASGQAAPDEIYTHPHRSIIYRSIGDKPLVEVDTDVLPLAAGDRLVLCSDGLWEMIRSEGIADVLMQEADPQRASDLLVQHANAAGGDDNISVVVVQVEGVA